MEVFTEKSTDPYQCCAPRTENWPPSFVIYQLEYMASSCLWGS